MRVYKGDIGIELAGAQVFQGTKEPFKGDHTFLISADGELTDATPTIHLTWGGLETWDFGSFRSSTKYILHCNDSSLGSRAIEYAASWLRIVPAKNQGVGRDTYSKPRARAVMHDIGSRGALPFEFDALRRALKWHRRMDAPFSTRKGLTCAAWAVACYQAAAFRNPSLTAEALDSCWSHIAVSRKPKVKEAARVNLPGVKDPNYRESVNAGAKTPGAMSEALAMLKLDKTESDDALLARLLTKALMVDARFLHTDGLVRRVCDDNQGWTVTKYPCN